MSFRNFAILTFFIVSACTTENSDTYKNAFIPPDPKTRKVAYVEMGRDFGVLGGVRLIVIDERQVFNPEFIRNPQIAASYQEAVKEVPFSDDSTAEFLAVPAGDRELGYFFLPGLTWRGMNPFSPGPTFVAFKIVGTLRPNRHYRAFGEEGAARHSYRFWIEDLQTGETIAATSVQ
ncbi:hypothetical protein [Actibacterium pelagium]|uniref:Lipoprotein n=1 Tax=Actibacterium pelagium TaxID=2029103 RepID=A0A917ELJ5_9RHOB|nr:hypothetical protein [Actibacterium pelagium]GGE52281.1 hypothetical protein GCM10011517_20080 [Actibacterium pelagium]